MTTYIYEEVKMSGQKRGKCPHGKYITRRKTFCNTINPFNKNEDGSIKNHYEVSLHVMDLVKIWKEQPITDCNCETT